MKVKILKEGKNFGDKIADLILAGKDSQRQAAEFIKMDIAPMEDIVAAVVKMTTPIYQNLSVLKDKRNKLYSDMADYQRMDDYSMSDKLSWDINSVEKEIRQATQPLNNIYDFWKTADVDGDYDYVDKVDMLLHSKELRNMVPGLAHAWKGNHDYDEDNYGFFEHKQNNMKQLLETFKRNVITEAAKNAKDLQSWAKSVKDDQWLRGLWTKYGMWELGDMLNIGIPQEVKDKWRQYSPQLQLDLRNRYWKLMLKKLPPIPVVIAGETYGDSLEVSYGAIFPSFQKPARLLKFDAGVQPEAGDLMQKSRPMKGMPGGSITFHKAEKNDGECSDAFIVGSTHQTTKGWGPMLYDIAMEVATILGGGLTSSRNLVSSKAKPVWDYYHKRRNDVEVDQLDVDGMQAMNWGLKQITPKKPEDDCKQGSSYKWAHGEDYGAWDKGDVKTIFSKMRGMSDEEKSNVPWDDVSLSKVYKKDPDIIEFLGSNGLFHCPSLGYNAIEFHTKELPPLPPPEKPPPEPPTDKEVKAAFARRNVSENKIRIKIK